MKELTVKLPEVKRNPFWYLEHKDDLAVVTSESSNTALGINDIVIHPPNSRQKEIGILCKVVISTLTGTLSNISIEQANVGHKALRIKLPSKNIAAPGERAKFVNDFIINTKCKAQILSYVSTFLEEVTPQE